MDVNKLIPIIKKMLRVVNLMFNFMLLMCCYLTFKTIRENDINSLIFAISMFVVGICGLVFIKFLKKFLFGDE